MHTIQNTQDIRNIKKRLIGRYFPSTSTLEILIKGCLTRIRFLSNGKIEVTNIELSKK